jgi:hypothetical protein
MFSKPKAAGLNLCDVQLLVYASESSWTPQNSFSDSFTSRTGHLQLQNRRSCIVVVMFVVPLLCRRDRAWVHNVQYEISNAGD